MKENQLKRDSILSMAQGAIEERADYEVSRVIDNILDPNTKPDAKRKLTITLELQPDSERKHIHVSASAKTTLAPTTPVKPRLSLQPFRTFREVPQPESEFILRLDENGRIGLYEADGGIWKIEAKINIMQFFNTALEDEIEAGRVVVMV